MNTIGSGFARLGIEGICSRCGHCDRVFHGFPCLSCGGAMRPRTEQDRYGVSPQPEEKT